MYISLYFTFMKRAHEKDSNTYYCHIIGLNINIKRHREITRNRGIYQVCGSHQRNNCILTVVCDSGPEHLQNILQMYMICIGDLRRQKVEKIKLQICFYVIIGPVISKI